MSDINEEHYELAEELTSSSIPRVITTDAINALPALKPKDEDQEISEVLAGIHSKEYTPLDIKDAVELLYVFHPLVSSGAIKLYEWQKEILKFICNPAAFTRDFPLHFILCASNGSGKDAYVIAPFAVWHCVSKIRSRCIITSSSYKQIHTQTEPSVKILAEAVNRHFGEQALIIKQNHIVSKITGSEILMFATDDPGMAEGYHPWPDYPMAEMSLVINEAKTVNEGIFGALRRCNGYNRWLEVSSPGTPSGHFFSQFKKSTRYPDKYKKAETMWYSRRVTSYDNEHISKAVIEDDKRTLGESSPLFRSMHLAEFTDLSENPVIPAEILDKVIDLDVTHIPNPNGVSLGIDLSFGGEDESVGYCMDGNKIADMFSFRGLVDTVVLKDRLLMHCNDYKARFGLKPENVVVDDGNKGGAVIDMMRRENWQVCRCINQSRAILDSAYANRGAELYFHVKRLIEERAIGIPSKYEKLIDQLRSRKCKESLSMRGKIVLESKKEARARGVCSPDHADAFVLAMSRLQIDHYVKTLATGNQPVEVKNPRLTANELINKFEETKFEPEIKLAIKPRFNGSINTVIKYSKHLIGKV